MALPEGYPTRLKACPQCNRDLPLSAYYLQPKRALGVSCWCKECTRRKVNAHLESHRDAYNARGRQKHRLRRAAAPIDPTCYVQLRLFEQVCRRCGVSKPLAVFGVNRARWNGRHAWCLDCCHAHSYERYHANPALWRAIRRRRYWADPQKHRLLARRWYWADLERSRALGRLAEKRNRARRIERKRARYKRDRLVICAKASAYGRLHRAQIRERERAAYAANPTRFIVKEQRRRARLKALPGTFTLADLLRIYHEQDGRCLYCGKELHGRYHIEHRIPITRPGSSGGPENIACSCGSCNSRKGTMTDEEFLAKLRTSRERAS